MDSESLINFTGGKSVSAFRISDSNVPVITRLVPCIDCFKNFLEHNRSLPVNHLIEHIKIEINEYTGTTEQFDDRTVLAFEIKA